MVPKLSQISLLIVNGKIKQNVDIFQQFYIENLTELLRHINLLVRYFTCDMWGQQNHQNDIFSTQIWVRWAMRNMRFDDFMLHNVSHFEWTRGPQTQQSMD